MAVDTALPTERPTAPATMCVEGARAPSPIDLVRALVIDPWGAFVVEPLDGQRTRLISRSRVRRGWAALAYVLLLEIPHFVMQRKMLLGIKERAERARSTG